MVIQVYCTHVTFIYLTGIGILSRKQIISSNVVNLTKTGGVDTNTRIGLHAQIRLGLDQKDIFNMIAVHFSYDKEQQCQNAEDIIKYISSRYN